MTSDTNEDCSLLADGYAPLMLADASSDTVAFGRTPVDLEQEFVQRTAGMLDDRIQVCPIRGGSTQDEARAIAKCLRSPLSKVMLVTSDYHSRRALSVLRREMPQYHRSVAAVTASRSFRLRTDGAGGSGLKRQYWSGVS